MLFEAVGSRSGNVMVLHNPRYIYVSMPQCQKKLKDIQYIYIERVRIHFAPSCPPYGMVSLHATMECSTCSTITANTTVAFLVRGVVLVLYH